MPAKTTVRVALINNAAKDDSFSGETYDWLEENGSLAGALNVLGNDPGSATLFSVSDTLPTGTGTMIPQACDTFTVTHDGTTYTGKLTINADGTVGFDLSSMSGYIDSLAEGETITVDFYYTAKMANGVLSTAKVTVEIVGENDGPTTSLVTLAAIAEDSGARLITQAELLANADDAEGDALTATGLAIATGGGTLVDNGDGSWTYTPADNDDTEVSFTYTISDGNGGSAAGSADLDITPVNDAPELTGAQATLANGTEDTDYVVSAGDLLAGFTDVEGDTLAVVNLTADHGTVIDNGDDTFTIELEQNYNGPVVLTYAVSDGTDSTAASQGFAVDAVNDAPTTAPVTLGPIAEDSAALTITEAELLAEADDVEGDTLAVTGLALVGAGTLLDNGDGSWSYTPALNDDTEVSFTYTISDGNGGSVAGSADLDITPVNDAPTTTPVTLVAIAEDSGARLITQAELLANAADVDNASLTATGLAIATGSGSLVDNLDGTWSYTPALNDDTEVSFSYTVTDGSLTASGSASLDITPVNDAPTTDPVTLGPIAEDSAALTITEAELLAEADDVEGDTLAVTGLALVGAGTLLDNGDGSWSYTPALNDDTEVSFTYTISDGNGGSVAGSADLDITPVNDAPTTTPVTLVAIAEDSGARLITQAELLANAADVDNASLTATGLAIATGSGSLVDNLDGTWSYTPALNDDTEVSFSYTVTDGSLTASGSASLDITPVNDLAVIQAGGDTGSVTEDAVPNTVTGNLATTDVDSPPDSWTAIASPTATTYGSFTMTTAGAWTYTLDNTNPIVNALDTGSPPLADSFTVYTGDGQSKVVSITINGTSDVALLPAVVSATTTGDPNDFDASGNPLGQGPAGFGTNAAETIYGGAGDDNINAGSGNDTVYAGSGNDTANGANNSDTLYGGSGEDVLTGANDPDTLVGGWGADNLTGSNGNDTFKFLTENDRGDYIADFSTAGGDKIDVSALDATHFSAGAEAFGLWSYGAGSTSVQGTSLSGTVYAADTDGNASTIEFWFVVNSATPALTGADFLF